MAKAFVVIKNGKYIVARVDSKGEAEDAALELLAESPSATFESGKLDKRVYTTTTPGETTVIEENQ